MLLRFGNTANRSNSRNWSRNSGRRFLDGSHPLQLIDNQWCLQPKQMSSRNEFPPFCLVVSTGPGPPSFSPRALSINPPAPRKIVSAVSMACRPGPGASPVSAPARTRSSARKSGVDWPFRCESLEVLVVVGFPRVFLFGSVQLGLFNCSCCCSFVVFFSPISSLFNLVCSIVFCFPVLGSAAKETTHKKGESTHHSFGLQQPIFYRDIEFGVRFLGGVTSIASEKETPQSLRGGKGSILSLKFIARSGGRLPPKKNWGMAPFYKGRVATFLGLDCCQVAKSESKSTFSGQSTRSEVTRTHTQVFAFGFLGLKGLPPQPPNTHIF